MIASLVEVYPGARFEVVDWDKIPSKLRAHVCLTETPADPTTILAWRPRILEGAENWVKYGT